MNPTKKQRERRSLDAVLERIALAANVVIETEEPDFLLTIDRAVVGAEVTELFLPPPSNAVLPMQATENEERLMVAKAREQAIRRAVPPQLLQVRLRPQVVTKQSRDRVATALCDYVASNFAAAGEVKCGEPPLPREIVHITMYGLPNGEHQWHGPCSGWLNSEFADGFRGAIGRKTPLLATYRQRCEKCWLIMVANGDGGSSFIEWSDQLASQEFETDFDRVYFVQGLEKKVFELRLRRNLLGGTAG